MRTPTIHLNGSSAEELQVKIEDAISAVFLARNALMLCAPNARDYYPQGEGAYAEAAREHDARSKRLYDVQNELNEIGESIVKHLEERARRKR